MSEQDDGGSAFPDTGCGLWAPSPGMTLLDWFAGQVCASYDRIEKDEMARAAKKGGLEADAVLARVSYEIAAAMVAEKRRRESAPAAPEEKP